MRYICSVKKIAAMKHRHVAFATTKKTKRKIASFINSYGVGKRLCFKFVTYITLHLYWCRFRFMRHLPQKVRLTCRKIKWKGITQIAFDALWAGESNKSLPHCSHMRQVIVLPPHSPMALTIGGLTRICPAILRLSSLLYIKLSTHRGLRPYYRYLLLASHWREL